jgi:hypothetical protein
MRGGHSPFALQQRSAEVRRAKRAARERAELERQEASATSVSFRTEVERSATPLPTPAVQVPPDDESAGSEPGFVLPSWLRFGSRVSPAPVPVRLAHVPVSRDIRAETANYNAELGERVAQRDAALPRVRGRTKFLYGSDSRGPGPTPGQVMDFKF